MLNFERLQILQKYYDYIQKKTGVRDYFLVGGALRDILLGIKEKLDDVDLTIAGEPIGLYAQMEKEAFSHFITEKFWTITLIPKEWVMQGIKYEITPFREESGYQDVRHPDDIRWTNSLLADAKRRDFRINAMYYRFLNIKKPVYEEKKVLDSTTLLKVLDREWFVFLENSGVLILQKASLIDQLLQNGQMDSDFLYYLLDIQHFAYCYGEDGEKTDSEDRFDLQIVIDPEYGIHSLLNRKLETVGDPDIRFQEDALRLLRGLRFVNVINQKLLNNENKEQNADPLNKVRLFDFETETWKSIKKNHDLLKTIAKERIYQEIVKSFSEGNPFGLVALVDEAEMLPVLFPALAKTKGYDQPIRYHPFDIYAHIILTLWHLQQINSNYLVRFAMLYHDVGKVGQYEQYGLNLTREEIRNILAGPLNHRFSSAELMKEDFKNLWFSNKEIEEIKRYINEHHTPGEILMGNSQNWTKRLRKLFSEVGYEKLQNLLDINIADRLWMYNPLQNSSDLTDSYYLKTLVDEIEQTEGQFKKSDLAITGADVMEHFDLKPGKLIGELLQVGFDWVLGDVKHRNVKKQILANIANYLKQKK